MQAPDDPAVGPRPVRAGPSRLGEDGFGLAEVMVAMFVVAAVLLAGASALVSSLGSTASATSSTRATQVANQSLEQLTALPWNALGVHSTDPNFVTSFEGYATAALAPASTPDQRVPAAVRTVVRAGTSYTVRTHVVRLPDSDTSRVREAQRRLTVLVEWRARGLLRTVRVDSTRTPTTGETGNQCFGLRSLEVLMRDSTAATTPDPFALTGDRLVPVGSQLVATATTSAPATGVTLVYQVIDPVTATMAQRSAAMAKVSSDDRTWQFDVPADQQFAVGQQTFTATATTGTTSTACPATTSTLEAYPHFTHPAGVTPSTLRVATGKNHSCRIDGNSRVWCWGLGNGGALGHGSSSSSSTPVATGVGVAGFVDLVSVSAGDAHSCAVGSDGSAWCWGNNSSGQVGDGTNTNRLTPVKVVGLSEVVAVSAGVDFTCAVTRGGAVWCWGNNASGQLGDGTTDASNKPRARVQNLTTAITTAAGTDHACAITSSGRVLCWGSGAALRLNGAASSRTPVEVVLPGSPTPVAREVAINNRSSQAHSCVTATGGAVFCWGDNNNGQVVLGAPNPTTVQRVTGLPPAQDVTAGAQYSCAVVTPASGTPESWCWGLNNVGQLGTGTTGGATAPTRVSTPAGLTGSVDLTASLEHTCARVLDNSVWCWGSNEVGKLGDGTTTTRTLPTRVSGT